LLRSIPIFSVVDSEDDTADYQQMTFLESILQRPEICNWP